MGEGEILCLRNVLLPSVRMYLTGAPKSKCKVAEEARNKMLVEVGIEELACGDQASIATSLFDPSMSALPIIVKQNSQSVGLFTR